MRVLEMTRGFAAALREELDFRIEARNIAAVASTSRVRVPAVYGQWSTSRVLVLEYLDGVAVRHAEPVFAASGADRHGLAPRPEARAVPISDALEGGAPVRTP